MAGPIDRLIEDHRRDPDPHPRLSQAIQTQVDDLNARLSAIDGGDPESPIAVPQPAASMPEPVAEQAGRPGTSTDYARGDHRHQLELPANLDGLRALSGTGVMMRSEAGTVTATTGPTVDALTITGQAGVGQRMMSAFADGGQVAVDDVRYVPGVDVPASTIIAIAANQVGLSSVLRPAGWATQDVIPGRSLNCATWSGAYWFADCTDGTVHRSIDGITWEILGVTVSAAAKVNALDAVVVVSDFLTGVKVSLDGGTTWQSHTPYGGSPNTHNASCILRLGNGVYRIFDGGQTGTGTASGIIVSADTDAMPTPGDAWTVRYSGSSAAVFNVSLGPVGVVSATTLPSGNIAVLTSADGLAWEIVDTGISSVAGRSVFYSAIHAAYFIGATNGGSTGSVITSTDLVTFTETITGLGGPVDSFSEGGGKLYCGSNGGGAWEITVSTKAAVASGTIGYVGGDGRPAQAVASDPVLELGGTTAIRVGGQSGTGERVVVAQADGSQRDVDEVTWDGNGLKVTINTNTWIGYRVKNNGTGTAAAASLSFENNSGVQSYVESYGSGNTPTIAGISRANAAAFMGGGAPLSAVFYGLDNSVSAAAPVCFVWKENEEGRFTSDGWTFRQRIQVTADAGTGQRLMSASADGHHLPIAEATWAGGVLTLNGKLVLPPSVAGSAYLNLGDGAAVTTLVNGDFWLSGSILHYRSAGTTYDVVPTARNVATQWSLTGGGSLASNRTLNLVNDLAVPPTDADYGTDSMRRRGWYKGNESLPTPAPFSPSRSSFGTFPTGPIAVPALNPAAAFAAFAHGA